MAPQGGAAVAEAASAPPAPAPTARDRFAGMLDPATYPHPVDRVEVRETHVSRVFLAGEYAYKAKKPVDLGFVDFRTVDRRRLACRDEVRLNRRLCRGLYLGVAHLADRGGHPHLHLVGRVRDPAAEPLVRMRRLPESGMLAHLLEAGAADAALMRRIAGRLARFHARAATGAGVDDFGGPAAVAANWAENFAQTAPFIDAVAKPDEHALIRRYVATFLRRRGALMVERLARGRVRDGHGDLHANNICLAGARLYLFDCLEFAPRYRCADVAADVAFLAMDLDHHGRSDLADAFAAEYVRVSGDAELPVFLDFYRCYRAYVRGKVLGLQARQAEAAPGDGGARERQARAYFALAAAYAARDAG